MRTDFVDYLIVREELTEEQYWKLSKKLRDLIYNEFLDYVRRTKYEAQVNRIMFCVRTASCM